MRSRIARVQEAGYTGTRSSFDEHRHHRHALQRARRGRRGSIGTMAARSASETPDARAGEIDRLPEEHRRADFPDRSRGERVGVDLVRVGAALIGVATTWLHDGRRVGATRQTLVSACRQDLDRPRPQLRDVHERRYAGRLRELAGLLAAAGR